MIGVGSRGTALMKQFSKVHAVEIGAVVDPDGNRAEKAAGWVRKTTATAPKSNPTCATPSKTLRSTGS